MQAVEVRGQVEVSSSFSTLFFNYIFVCACVCLCICVYVCVQLVYARACTCYCVWQVEDNQLVRAGSLHHVSETFGSQGSNLVNRLVCEYHYSEPSLWSVGHINFFIFEKSIYLSLLAGFLCEPDTGWSHQRGRSSVEEMTL